MEPITRKAAKMNPIVKRIEKLEEKSNGHPSMIVSLENDNLYHAADGRTYKPDELANLSERAGLPVLIWDVPIPEPIV